MVNYTLKIYWGNNQCIEEFEYFRNITSVRSRSEKIALEGFHVNQGEEGFFIPPQSISHVTFEETVQEEPPCDKPYVYWIIIGVLVLWIVIMYIWAVNK